MLRAVILCLAMAFASPATPQTRHALVVGIDAYDELPALSKAVADARIIADVLDYAGFDVTAGYDLDRGDFVRLLSGFVAQLTADDEVMVFYAGHAVEINRRNYLIPRDAAAVNRSSEAQVIAESIGQDFLLEQITARDVRLTVVIMDACRDKPFEGLQVRGSSALRGLAVETPPRGVFMLYSADEGQGALDGLGPGDEHPNSVFTRTLVPLLEEPGLDIVEVSRQLRGNVEGLARSVGHPQFPVYRDRMRGDGRFVVTLAAAVEPSVTDPCETARADWALLGSDAGVEALEAFFAAHGDCNLLAALVRQRLHKPTPAAASATGRPLTPERMPAPAASGTVKGLDLQAATTTRDMVQLCRDSAAPASISFSALEAADPGLAAELCEAALDSSRDDPDLLFFAGRARDANAELSRAAQFYQQAAAGGQADAMNNLALLLDKEDNPLRDPSGAISLFMQAADAGSVIAAYNLALRYQDGNGVSQDEAQAAHWYRRAAEAGDADAMLALGWRYETSTGLERELALAREWYEAAAQAGNATAMNNLGLMHDHGRGVPRSDDLAFEWYARAARAGNADGMANLGWMYAHGAGTATDENEAVRWYRLAADGGSAGGMRLLGWMYENGRGGVAASERDALDWYRAAAEAGDSWGMNNLVVFLRDGRATEPDHEAAIHWFEAAAEVGNERSMRLLGEMHARGEGVTESAEEAVLWYRRAAEAGETETMFALGQAYASGEGVARDYVHAAHWFRAAADAGHGGAMNSLSFRYEFGEGVAQDHEQAAHWQVRAAQNGISTLTEFLDEGAWGTGFLRALQQILRDEGAYDGPLDGQFGPRSRAALAQYLEDVE